MTRLRTRLFVAAAVLSVLVAEVRAQATDWRGFYLGANLGVGSNEAEASTTVSGSFFASSSYDEIALYGAQKLDAAGFAGSGLAGYNFPRLGPVVLSIESDFGVLRFEESASTSAEYSCCPPATFTVSQSVEATWLFTARARVGVPLGQWLPYATAGVALTRLNYREVFSDTFASAAESGSFEETVSGLALGGGVEYSMGGPWSGRLEFLYSDFENATTTSNNLTADFGGGPIPYPGETFHHTSDFRTSTVRAGASYGF